MRPLIQPLSDHERVQVGLELERLHVLQDKPFNEAKRVMFVQELSTGVWPLAAVIQGIKSLNHEDLRSIKLNMLIEAAGRFTEKGYNKANCDHCFKDGCVLMIDTQGASFALACICSNGDAIVTSQNLVRWNGNSIQESNGRMLFRSKDSMALYVPPETAERVQGEGIKSDQEVADVVAMMGGTIVDPGMKI